MNRLFAICGWVLPLGLYLAATSPAASGQTAPSAANGMLQGAATSVATPNSFIKLTLPDGSEGRLPPNTVIRIRKAISTENRNGAKARIDWVQMMLVREPPAEVAALVEGVSLHLANCFCRMARQFGSTLGQRRAPCPCLLKGYRTACARA